MSSSLMILRAATVVRNSLTTSSVRSVTNNAVTKRGAIGNSRISTLRSISSSSSSSLPFGNDSNVKTLRSRCGENYYPFYNNNNNNELIQQNLQQKLQQQQQQQVRMYVSRAHPNKIPEFPLPSALQQVLDGIEDRKVKRAARWERNTKARQAKGQKDDGPYRNQDETLELAINLNLDPRKPGQAIRGSVALPHGTGKVIKCIVFTNDKELCKTIVDSKLALYCGGDELIEQIQDGTISLDSFQRALATKDILPTIQKQLARVLGPRGLMPNLKVGTVFNESNDLLDNIHNQSSSISFRCETAGIIHVPIGKGSFTTEQLLDNIRSICQTIQNVKPEQYGKGKEGGGGGGKKKKGANSKKMGKNVKYWLRAHISSTQGKGIRIDTRTVDPTSPFFLKNPTLV